MSKFQLSGRRHNFPPSQFVSKFDVSSVVTGYDIGFKESLHMKTSLKLNFDKHILKKLLRKDG